jgi:hypothetical protein
MTWGRFFHLNAKVAWNGPRNCSVRNIVIEWGEHGSITILRIPETDLNTIAKYHAWVATHWGFGKEVADALWLFLRREYQW